MDAFVGACALILAGAFVVGLVRGYRRERAEGRRDRERTAWAKRAGAQEKDAFISNALQYFPFVDANALERAVALTADPIAAMSSCLEATPGIRLGTGPEGLPILLPQGMRSRHAVVFGRTGSGKSTLASRVLDADLKYGRAIVVIGADQSFFRDDLLPRIPRSRAAHVVYLTAEASCPISLAFFEAEAEVARAEVGAALYHAYRQATDEASIGGRSDAIARNVFRALAGYPRATFDHIRPLLTDRSFRSAVLAKSTDPQLLSFWSSYDRFPKGSELPFLARIDQLTGSNARSILCRANSTFSLPEVLDRGVFLADLSALDPDAFAVVASLLLARIQHALLRRDRLPEADRPFVSILLDEFHLLAQSGSEYTFRQLLSRSRKLNAGLLLLTQHPGQLPGNLRDEILGNVSTVISFAAGAKDAQAIAREFVVPRRDKPGLTTLAPETLVSLPVGSGFARIGTGALALPVRFLSPLDLVPKSIGEEIRAVSWATHGGTDRLAVNGADGARFARDATAIVRNADSLPETCRLFLAAVLERPGLSSSVYAATLGLNGTRAAQARKTLVAEGYLREHRVARQATGKPALILEPLPKARAIAPNLTRSIP